MKQNSFTGITPVSPSPNLSEAMKLLLSIYGEAILADADWISGLLLPLAPGLTRERKFLSLVYQTDGMNILTDASQKGADMQKQSIEHFGEHLLQKLFISPSVSREYGAQIMAALSSSDPKQEEENRQPFKYPSGSFGHQLRKTRDSDFPQNAGSLSAPEGQEETPVLHDIQIQLKEEENRLRQTIRNQLAQEEIQLRQDMQSRLRQEETQMREDMQNRLQEEKLLLSRQMTSDLEAEQNRLRAEMRSRLIRETVPPQKNAAFPHAETDPMGNTSTSEENPELAANLRSLVQKTSASRQQGSCLLLEEYQNKMNATPFLQQLNKAYATKGETGWTRPYEAYVPSRDYIRKLKMGIVSEGYAFERADDYLNSDFLCVDSNKMILNFYRYNAEYVLEPAILSSYLNCVFDFYLADSTKPELLSRSGNYIIVGILKPAVISAGSLQLIKKGAYILRHSNEKTGSFPSEH